MMDKDIIMKIFSKDAEGAIPKDSRIEKVNGEEGDITLVGTKGTVIGSVDAPPGAIDTLPEKFYCKYMYLVKFDNAEHLAMIIGSKIKEI